MAVCAKCKETFSDDFIFCPNCGKKREDKCTCGATLSPGMRYCGKCGKITQIEAKRQEEERRRAEELAQIEARRQEEERRRAEELEEFKRLAEEKWRSAVEEKEREKRRLAAKRLNLKYVDQGDYIELIHPIGNIRMIEKVCSPNWMYEYDAERYAINLRKGGFSDWRIPTKEELLEIYEIKDICGYRIFSEKYDFLSSTRDNTWGKLIKVNFGSGRVHFSSESNDGYVRCVR